MTSDNGVNVTGEEPEVSSSAVAQAMSVPMVLGSDESKNVAPNFFGTADQREGLAVMPIAMDDSKVVADKVAFQSNTVWSTWTQPAAHLQFSRPRVELEGHNGLHASVHGVDERSVGLQVPASDFRGAADTAFGIANAHAPGLLSRRQSDHLGGLRQMNARTVSATRRQGWVNGELSCVDAGGIDDDRSTAFASRMLEGLDPKRHKVNAAALQLLPHPSEEGGRIDAVGVSAGSERKTGLHVFPIQTVLSWLEDEPFLLSKHMNRSVGDTCLRDGLNAPIKVIGDGLPTTIPWTTPVVVHERRCPDPGGFGLDAGVENCHLRAFQNAGDAWSVLGEEVRHAKTDWTAADDADLNFRAHGSISLSVNAVGRKGCLS